MSRVGRGSAHRNNFIGRALVGVLTSVRLKTDPHLTALLSLLARALLNKLWLRLIELLQKRSQPLTSGRALNQYLVKFLKKPFKA